MSTSYSVFIETSISLLEVKTCLEAILNCQLSKDNSAEWDIYRTILMGLEISLLEATGYEDDEGNDKEIKLSKYNYYVGIDYISNVFAIDYEAEWRLMTSLILGSMISRKLHCECIAVRNVQILLERFLPE